jgi:hypothetical protein
VLPIGLLLVGIAAIAWAAQYLPGRARQIQPTNDGGTAAVRFSEEVAGWGYEKGGVGFNGKNVFKVLEFGTPEGQYDFVFENTGSSEVELGAIESSCTCQRLEVFVVDGALRETFLSTASRRQPPMDVIPKPHTWQKISIDKEMRQTVKIPPGAVGVVRVVWRGPGADTLQPEQDKSYTATLWSQGGGPGHGRGMHRLAALVKYVQPALFAPEAVDFGILGPGQKRTESFLCWSATRNLDVRADNSDKTIETEVKRLTRREKAAIFFPLFPFCAFEVKVTLHERAAGKQLNLGSFHEKHVPIEVRGAGTAAVRTPELRASVTGGLRINWQGFSTKLELGVFRADREVKKDGTLYLPQGFVIRYDEKDQTLAINVSLKEIKEPGSTENCWKLEIRVPPRSMDAGPVPENSVLVLRVEFDKERWRPALAGTLGVGAAAAMETAYPSRLVRLPVTGIVESAN